MRALTRLGWRTSAGAIALACALTLGACASDTPATNVSADTALAAQLKALDIQGFESTHPGLHVDVITEPGIEAVTITNYDPHQIPPPARQDMVAYGRTYSSEATSGQTVYTVSVMEGEQSYTVEFDPISREQILEQGAWFLPENRDSYVTGQLATLNELLESAP